MLESSSDAQWTAARALVEGASPTHARVAACMGVRPAKVSRRAAQHGWKSLNFGRSPVRAAHRSMIALAAAARAGEELDPVGLLDGEGLDEAERDAVADGLGGVEELTGGGEPAELVALGDLPVGERIARIGTILTRRTEALLARVEAGQPLESREVTALSTLVQLSERIAVLAREEAAKNVIEEDREIGEVLAKIDRRITYLAKGYARMMAVDVFGIPQAEVDEKMPEPVEE